MESPKYPHIISSEVKKTNEDSRMQKDDNKLNGLDKSININLTKPFMNYSSYEFWQSNVYEAKG